MPKNAPKIKIKNTKRYGADIVFYDPENESREMIGENLAQKESRVLIKPYDDLDIIAGQGTAGLEIVSQLEDIDQLSLLLFQEGGRNPSLLVLMQLFWP